MQQFAFTLRSISGNHPSPNQSLRMTHFKTIGLFTKPDDEKLVDTILLLLEYLERHQYVVLADPNTDKLLQDHTLRTLNANEIARQCDLAIVVGGDGTLLHAAHSLAPADVPVIGINRGRLGFLVEISPEEMTVRLDRILSGHCKEDHRSLLHARIERQGKVIAESDAINDVVIRARDVIRMIEFDTFIDGQYLNRQRADGLIVATPTGSTAYALSGGGPILHPGLEVIELVPICPHTLTNRPIVVPPSSTIEVVICGHNVQSGQISFDGQSDMELIPEDRVILKRQTYRLRLLRSSEHDYFEILRAKLLWSEQP